jgi:hypothetical protein
MTYTKHDFVDGLKANVASGLDVIAVSRWAYPAEGMGSAKTHVKDFMIRHQNMLGIGQEDATTLKTFKDMGLWQ